MDDDLFLSPIRGLSSLDRRDVGREFGGCSDSEELDDIDEALDIVGDRLGRTSSSKFVVSIDIGSGNGFVAIL